MSRSFSPPAAAGEPILDPGIFTIIIIFSPIGGCLMIKFYISHYKYPRGVTRGCFSHQQADL